MHKWTKKQFVQLYIDHLRELANGEIVADDPTNGLCLELETLAAYVSKQFPMHLPINRRHLGALYKSWEFWSGDHTYPVPATRRMIVGAGAAGWRACDAYSKPRNMWEGEDTYVDLRLELCDFLADMLEDMEL